MNLFKNLKELKFGVLIPVCILSLIALVLAIVSTVTYGGNCASNYNGNQVSDAVMTFGTVAIVLAAIALVGDLAAFFFAKTKKIAYLFTFTRLFNYASFAFSLLTFVYEILDENPLLGGIFYPIVSGTVGDPIEPVLVTSFFASLIMGLIASLVSLAAGIIMRKKSYKILTQEKVEA